VDFCGVRLLGKGEDEGKVAMILPGYIFLLRDKLAAVFRREIMMRG